MTKKTTTTTNDIEVGKLYLTKAVITVERRRRLSDIRSHYGIISSLGFDAVVQDTLIMILEISDSYYCRDDCMGSSFCFYKFLCPDGRIRWRYTMSDNLDHELKRYVGCE